MILYLYLFWREIRSTETDKNDHIIFHNMNLRIQGVRVYYNKSYNNSSGRTGAETSVVYCFFVFKNNNYVGGGGGSRKYTDRGSPHLESHDPQLFRRFLSRQQRDRRYPINNYR